MEMLWIVLLLLILIGISNVINHIVPFIPVPLIQIALGVVMVVLPFGIHVPMESELFLVLFIAPLLFNDGRNASRTALWKLRVPILLLALGLVFVTVFVIGYLIHWLIPSIPLSAAFALAAILSPTDVVAVSAMSSRVHLPKNLMHILEGEGLMNDASGLVAFKFAVAATVTGYFSLANASLSFLVIAIGGFLGGAFLAYLIIQLRVLLRRFGMEDVTIHMLIQIITPFIIYLITEHFHLSGILAVVAAGIVHAIERDREKSPSIELQVVSKSTWSVILYILNGLVFVLLGFQIPSVGIEIFRDPQFRNSIAIGYFLIITAALLLLRFIWIFASWWVGSRLTRQRFPEPLLRPVGITTISGVRGAVTLAGAFSIPFVLADGSPFPERSLIIFIAAGVILVTLVVASIFLPLIAQSDEKLDESKNEEMERATFIRTKVAAIRAVKEIMDESNRSAALSIISDYNLEISQFKYEGKDAEAMNMKKATNEIRLKALDAESRLIDKMIKEKNMDRETAYMAQQYNRRMEMAVTNQAKYRFLFVWSLLKRGLHRISLMFSGNPDELREQRAIRHQKMIRLKTKMAEAAIQELKRELNAENKNIIFLVIGEYSELLEKIKQFANADAAKEYARSRRELKVKAFQAERDEVQSLYEKGDIPVELVRKVRRQINIREAYWIEESSLHM